MFHEILEHAGIYTLTQWLWYRSGQQERYVREWIRPKPGDRVLDIGCGPARLLDWLPDLRYVGYDPNPNYIADAQRRYPGRGQFHAGFLRKLSDEDVGTFDIVLANGVLHHLSDEMAQPLLEVAAKALKPGGRMITRDGCYEAGQGRLVRLLLRSDRGGYVRTPAAYESLVHRHFDLVRSVIVRDALRLPYSLIHLELKKR